MEIGRRERSANPQEGDAGLRCRQARPAQLADNDGNKRQTVEIQVTHVGPDLQFATAEVAKSTADGSPATAAVAG
jgi:hypothetical protein